LVAAVAFEIAFYCGLTYYRFWKAKTPSARKVADAMETIEQNSKLVYVSRRILAGATVTAFGIAILYLAVDMTALLIADFGYPDAAVPIYERIAILPRYGWHPALSMELLTGAYIDAKKYQQAEPLEMTLLKIRRDLAGEKSELVATMDFNIGEYYAKRDDVPTAVAYYNKAVALTKELQLPQGWGSPMTQLGILFRDNHRYPEADVAFQSAVAVRTRIFGPNSLKVADTLLEYAILKQLEHEDADARRMNARVASIDQLHPIKSHSGADPTPLIVMCCSLMIFIFRDKMVVIIAEFLKKRQAAEESGR
jgi:tetratricopeptide (TPR) repeat protein